MSHRTPTLVCLVGVSIFGIIVWYVVGPRAVVTTYRDGSRYNMQAIAMAMRAYHAIYMSYPPAHTTDASGQPIHSWRVLLLPYLGRSDLYDLYKFDEPWNSANNRLLLDQMPRHYGAPADRDRSSEETNYVVVTSRERSARQNEMVPLTRCSRPHAEKFLILEVRNPGIAWSEPRDLSLDEVMSWRRSPARASRWLLYDGGIFVGGANGKVSFVAADELEPAAAKRSNEYPSGQ